MKKFISTVLIIFFICMFCYSTFNIIKYVVDEKEQESLNDDLTQSAIKITLVQGEENEEAKEELSIDAETFSIDFEYLKSQNKDIVAWIYSKDTPINYPIVQGKDNDYYLRRLINGQYNQAGTLFIDYKNKGDFSDLNTIVYGHNMKNDSMFGTLVNYKNQDYYDSHKEIDLYTENANYKIKLYAGLTIDGNSNLYNITNSNKEFIKLKDKSDFKSDVIPNENDRIVMLSTCSYDYELARYVLLGVLEEGL